MKGLLVPFVIDGSLDVVFVMANSRILSRAEKCVSSQKKMKENNTCVFIFSNNPTIFAFVLLCGIHVETFNARKCRDVVIKVNDGHSDAEDAVLVIVGRCGDLIIG